MKVLILSANTGQGHNSCAQAIQEACIRHGDECVIEDVFGLVSNMLSRTIARSHDKAYRQKPQRARGTYAFMERHQWLLDSRRPVYQVMSMGGRRIARVVQDGGYDTVVCTHPLAAVILTAAVERGKLNVHTAFVATDYCCSPGVNGSRLDRYFIAHESITPAFVRAGVPQNAIVPAGIPVRQAFSTPVEAAQARKEAGLPSELKHLLIMCGSMGCGPMAEVLVHIVRQLPDGWQITVACGTNEELYRQLSAVYADNTNVHIRGYVQNMPQLLQSADLYLTKPGGLSTCEAAAAVVPMVFMDALAGCEEENLRHFVGLQAAVTADNPAGVAQRCVALMHDPACLSAMADVLRTLQGAHAAERVWQGLKDMTKEAEQNA